MMFDVAELSNVAEIPVARKLTPSAIINVIAKNSMKFFLADTIFLA